MIDVTGVRVHHSLDLFSVVMSKTANEACLEVENFHG